MSIIKLYSQNNNNNNTIPSIFKNSYIADEQHIVPEKYMRKNYLPPEKNVLDNARRNGKWAENIVDKSIINYEKHSDMLKRLPDPNVPVYRPPDEDLIILKLSALEDWLLKQEYLLDPEWLEKDKWYGGSRKKHKKEKKRKPTKKKRIKKMKKKRTIKRRR
tara:strand:+ start:19 stop:501 length:483 start_codon:yes stop_codon:yes gene_type:complete